MPIPPAHAAPDKSVCPKCGHGPLAAGPAPDAECPACGVILAKARARDAGTAAGRATRPDAGARESRGLVARALGSFMHVPPAVAATYWWARAGALVLFAFWTLAIMREADIPGGTAGSHFLWAVLTPFHEAGHYLVFRWFGEFVMTLGGTLGQHLMPLVLAVALLRRGDPFGASLFVWLLGFSVVMMGVYMYDAYDPQLTLLDGRTGSDSDGHDWQNLFGDLGLIRQARGIGRSFGVLGRMVMVGSLVWGALLLVRQRAYLSDHPFAEEDAGA